MNDFRVHFDPAVGCYHPGYDVREWSDEYVVWSYWTNKGQFDEFVERFGLEDAERMFSMDGTRNRDPLRRLRDELNRRGIAIHWW